MNISLDWFKSERKKELEALRIEEQKLKNDLLRGKRERERFNDIANNANLAHSIKPFKSMKLVDNVLTVVLQDGSIISKNNATIVDFTSVKEATCENDVIAVMATSITSEERDERDKEMAKAELNKITSSEIEIFESLDDFYVKDNSVYLKESGRTIPMLLVKKFIQIINNVTFNINKEDWQKVLILNEEYLSLKRFFLWCCLNPRAEVADELYEFLFNNAFRFTKQGFFVALRNVVTVEGVDTTIIQFISNGYNKIKGVWKKKPEDYRVVERDDEEYVLEKVGSIPNGKVIGNLKTLYEDLPNMKENRFTDNYTGTFDIRIGKIVSMPFEDCKYSTADCQRAGLHFTCDSINYVGCGDTSVLVLINPMKVVGIGSKKGRCYEYLPIMTVPRDESTQILHDLDFDTLDLDDAFTLHELESLEEKAKEGFSKEATKHEFNVPAISTKEIQTIVGSLNLMASAIKKRVQSLS